MDLSVLRRILDAGQTPMICGDAVMDDELGFTIVSTEGFFSYLADYLAPDRIILASDVDGVFDSDPKDNDDVRRLGAIDGANLDGVLSRLTAGSGADVTGGMAGKVKAAHELAWKLPDADVRIVGGLVPDRVRGALVGHGGGTRIRP
jgi:isopentenyl phosphate kinase